MSLLLLSQLLMSLALSSQLEASVATAGTSAFGKNEVKLGCSGANL